MRLYHYTVIYESTRTMKPNTRQYFTVCAMIFPSASSSLIAAIATAIL